MWSQVKKEQKELLDVVATNEMVGALASILLLHPIDTLK